jgi:hypothetical protein
MIDCGGGGDPRYRIADRACLGAWTLGPSPSEGWRAARGFPSQAGSRVLDRQSYRHARGVEKGGVRFRYVIDMAAVDRRMRSSSTGTRSKRRRHWRIKIGEEDSLLRVRRVHARRQASDRQAPGGAPRDPCEDPAALLVLLVRVKQNLRLLIFWRTRKSTNASGTTAIAASQLGAHIRPAAPHY